MIQTSREAFEYIGILLSLSKSVTFCFAAQFFSSKLIHTSVVRYFLIVSSRKWILFVEIKF